MSKKIYNGRFIANSEESFVLFIIGMRINNLFSFTKWIPIFKAMGPMIKELYQSPELGFYHTEYLLSWRGITLIQYWRSFEDLEAYARGETHSTAWRNFNNKIKNDGSVGIYHETYKVQKNASEAIYNNMPKFGLANVFTHMPVSSTTDTARDRIEK
ncbi:DUF4188 domain-containing protein [Bacillus shivajii]|uniref:DUF4188 domain-containing protein n=1 Tax=Bacillus shivajii TaxID=1983719 RepID=UPI001CFBA514|nr:DUF4188 domain-containing protein [Bacillus shivajii]UCZ54865.1 DUF4188 domain-containing protein [Bacillus shivajii]